MILFSQTDFNTRCKKTKQKGTKIFLFYWESSIQWPLSENENIEWLIRTADISANY